MLNWEDGSAELFICGYSGSALESFNFLVTISPSGFDD